MENKTCMYGGTEYSHGATICSNESELVCNNGNWEPTGKDCVTNKGCKCEEETKSAVVVQLSGSSDKTVSSWEDCAHFGMKTSHCWLKANGTEAKPKITITERKIKIEHHVDHGYITKTRLTGSGGDYSFGIGEAEIEPGSYTHWMEGQIATTNGQGELDSYVCYK